MRASSQIDLEGGATQPPVQRTRWCTGPVVAVTVIVFWTFAATSEARGSFPGRNGQITASGPRSDVFALRPNGTGFRTLPGCAMTPCGIAPEWAPDGRSLMVLAPITNGWTPKVMAADGSGQRVVPLSAGPSLAEDKPSFAPDGRHFAYTRYRRPGRYPFRPEVWRATLDGKEDRRLRAGSLPRWSPNGRKIAYLSRGGRLWIMKSRTGERIRTIGPEVSSFDWSPDGRRIVFEPPEEPALFVMRADGKGSPRQLVTARRLHPSAVYGWKLTDPVWAPNGRRIALAAISNPPETSIYSIWTISPSGRRKNRIFHDVQVGEDVAGEVVLSWQPQPR